MTNKQIILTMAMVVSMSSVFAQGSKSLSGRVISEEMELLPGMKIFSMDTVQLGSTNIDGYFEIEAPPETNQLLLGGIGMEWTSVQINDDCHDLEIIVMLHVIYDFISGAKEARKRKKRFRQIPKIHKEAFEQGLFQSEDTSCICYVFSEH